MVEEAALKWEAAACVAFGMAGLRRAREPTCHQEACRIWLCCMYVPTNQV